jgi:hydrogenase maturation protein HypF
MARSGAAAPLSSSAGRLFDAVAALCGLRVAVTYEGQAAIELEAVARREERGTYEVTRVEAGEGPELLDPRVAIRSVLADIAAGVPAGAVSARFHNGLADATAGACARAAGRAGTELVVLGGGVFQNRRLLEGVSARLDRLGLRVLIPERLPPNDGAVSYGQAAIAACRPQTPV